MRRYCDLGSGGERTVSISRRYFTNFVRHLTLNIYGIAAHTEACARVFQSLLTEAEVRVQEG
jgi:hypothetical protein